MDVKDFMQRVNDISKELLKNPIVVDAKESDLDKYMQNISLGILQIAVDIAKTANAAIHMEEKAKYDAQKSKVDILSTKAQVRKQYGINIKEDGTIEDKKDGLIDVQTKGFIKDQFYKIANIIQQENQMLVQNDLLIHDWQVDAYKMAIEAMSDGKIDFKVTGSGSSKQTTVRWRPDATEPNGL